LLVAAMMIGAWMLFACAVMAVCLYLARLVPLTGRQKPRPRN
jgi:hypothetical protein